MNFFGIYADFLKKFLRVKRPMLVVLDAFNGASGIVAKEVFADYPLIQLTTINDLPDGNFPAHGPNPLLAGVLKELCQKVIKQKADLGVAFDADGDRALFVDNFGRPVPAYVIAYLIFKNRRPPFVVDEPLFKIFQHLKVIDLKDIISTRVGYAFIQAAMRQSNISSTAEYSGHYGFEETFQADSALFALIQVLNSLSAQKQTLAEFYDNLPVFAVDMENFKFKSKFDKKNGHGRIPA
ncbi:MAG: Phosphoglucomutase, Phosphomannomutase [Parcubacteria group bacterium Gr01-1014_73]|nr:MAG: Phosphoglucomutase, Phosphomannomutase [Parcubacteria group bacterium Gr01-1014_73]